MTNREKFRQLAIEVFLLRPDEFRFDLKKQDVETWDSLGVVSLAVGVEEVFGYHMKPEEATGLQSFDDLMRLLESKQILFHEDA